MATALRLVTEETSGQRKRDEATEKREALEAVERLLSHDLEPWTLEAVDAFADCLRPHVEDDA